MATAPPRAPSWRPPPPRTPTYTIGNQQGLADPVFETPPDLLCPITHDVFIDPVLTAAGQVRGAFLCSPFYFGTDILICSKLRPDRSMSVRL